MFTGLVEAIGTVRAVEPTPLGRRLALSGFGHELPLGASVSVSGACLTVVASDPGEFVVELTAETLDRSTLGSLQVGGQVNLERALRAGARLDGHLVTGHVDAVAEVLSIEAFGDARAVGFSLSAGLSHLVAEKGSVCIEGVSLTVNRALSDSFLVMLIPHTLSVTTLGALGVGSRVNLEVDLLARYVARYLEQQR